MIHRWHGHPEERANVAVLTDVGGVDVRGVFAGGRDTVMTAQTITRDASMIKRCRDPAST